MKKILILIIVLTLSCPAVTSVFATSNPDITDDSSLTKLWENRDNYELVSATDDQYISKFEVNNVFYQVEEFINKENNQIKSKFYKIDDKKIYLGEQITNFVQQQDVISVEVLENNKIINQQAIPTSASHNSNNAENYNNANSATTYTTVSSKWFSQGVVNGSNTISRYTVAVIVALIGYISGGATGVVVSTIAQKVIDEHWQAVYWKQETWIYMQRSPSWPSYPNWIQAGGYKYYTRYYSDSARTNYKGATTVVNQ